MISAIRNPIVTGILISALVLAISGPASAEVIDFEDLSTGDIVFADYYDLGVEFSTFPKAFAPSAGTSSGTLALTHWSEQAELDASSMEIAFALGQTAVGMSVGLAVPTINTVDIELHGYDAQYNWVATDVVTIGPGPASVTTWIEIQDTGGDIQFVELVFDGAQFETIDDLTFTDPGTFTYSDHAPPIVELKLPVDRGYQDVFAGGGDSFRLAGSAFDTSSLAQITWEVDGPNGEYSSGQLQFWSEWPYSYFDQQQLSGALVEGENLVTVYAEDIYGNIGSDSAVLHFEPWETPAELLVIYPTALRTPLPWFCDWKEMSGISCNITSVEAIDSDRRFMTAIDIQEKIKQAIAMAYEAHGTRYVMLVGDVDQHPVRYISFGRQGVELGKRWAFSDLYYADLFNEYGRFEDWNDNRNEEFGEWWFGTFEWELANSFNHINIDGADLYPDVAVGRVPASNKRETIVYIAKAFGYEINLDNEKWYNRHLMFNGSYDADNDHGELNWLAQNTQSGFNYTTCYRPSGWSEEDYDAARAAPETVTMRNCIFDALKNGVGFATYYGHGWFSDYVWAIDKDDVPSFNNLRMLPFMFARACRTGMIYDDVHYKDNNGVFPPQTGWTDPKPQPAPVQPPEKDIESMAEALLVKHMDGAVAYIGAMMDTNVPGNNIGRLFFESYDQVQHRGGDMWNHALSQFILEYLYNDIHHVDFDIHSFYSYHVHSFVYYGDPSIRLGGVPPEDWEAASRGDYPYTVEEIEAALMAMLKEADAQQAFEELHVPRRVFAESFQIKGATLPFTRVTAALEHEQLASVIADRRGVFEMNIKGLPNGSYRLAVEMHEDIERSEQYTEIEDRTRYAVVDVYLEKPTVKDLHSAKRCGPTDTLVSGTTEFAGTVVKLLDRKGRLIASDIADLGGQFSLSSRGGLRPGRHVLTLQLSDAAGFKTELEEPIVVHIKPRYQKRRKTPHTRDRSGQTERVDGAGTLYPAPRKNHPRA